MRAFVVKSSQGFLFVSQKGDFYYWTRNIWSASSFKKYEEAESSAQQVLPPNWRNKNISVKQYVFFEFEACEVVAS